MMEELGDPGEAVRAKADPARRHAEDLRGKTREPGVRAAEQREAELLYCARCNATWRAEAIREATRRQPGCLLCGGRLVPAPSD
jgi:hypothetical protein